MPLGQHLTQQRQHRGVGKMEHHGANQEHDQWTVAEQHPDAMRLAAFPAAVRATGNVVVDLCGPDQKQGEKRGDRQNHDEEENAPVGSEVAEEAHRHSGGHVPRRVERLIAALADVECGASDDPERNGTDGRAEDARCSADEDLGRHHRPKGWHDCDQQRPHRQCDDAGGDQRSLRPQPVDQRARRRLGEDSGDSANGESESYALLVPPLSRQESRQKWSDSRLHVGEKKVQPIQTAQRSRRRGGLDSSERFWLAGCLHGKARGEDRARRQTASTRMANRASSV